MLILWDIDQTLLDVGSFDRTVWSETCAELLGAPPHPVDTIPGQTIRQILRDVLIGYGASTENAERLLPQAIGGERDRLRAEPDLAAVGRVLPGADAAVRRIASQPGFFQSVLTGNQHESAAVKLGAFGLADALDLDAGAYGSDREDRHQLVPIARDRARDRYGHDVADPTVLIGDSLLDIDAAHRNAAVVIAVATGPTDAGRLAAGGAEAVLPDLQNTEKLVELLHGFTQRST